MEFFVHSEDRITAAATNLTIGLEQIIGRDSIRDLAVWTACIQHERDSQDTFYWLCRVVASARQYGIRVSLAGPGCRQTDPAVTLLLVEGAKVAGVGFLNGATLLGQDAAQHDPASRTHEFAKPRRKILKRPG